MSGVIVFCITGSLLLLAGLARMMLANAVFSRLMGMNVMGVGALLLLVALASRQTPPDGVLSALALTGLVIAVAFAGVGVTLVRYIEAGCGAMDEEPAGRRTPMPWEDGADDTVVHSGPLAASDHPVSADGGAR